jgi:hypothetical protein
LATAPLRGESLVDLLPGFRYLALDHAVYWFRPRAEQRDIQELAVFFGGQDHQLRTVGPCMLPDDGRMVSNFIVQAFNGEALTLYGDGSQTRSFCFVDDLIEGMIRLIDQAHTGETAAHKSF